MLLPSPACIPIALSLLFHGAPGHIAQLNMDGSWTVRDWNALRHFEQSTPVQEGRCLAHELFVQKDSLRFTPAPPDPPACDHQAMWRVILNDPVYQACHMHIA